MRPKLAHEMSSATISIEMSNQINEQEKIKLVELNYLVSIINYVNV